MKENERDILLNREDYVRQIRFYGCYRGQVEYVQDPLMLGRVKVRVPLVYGMNPDKLPPQDDPKGCTKKTQTQAGLSTEGLPWCYILQNMQGGTYNRGSYVVPEVDSSILVIFEGGNPDYPIGLGTYPSMPIEKILDSGEKHLGATERSESPMESMAMIDDKPTIRMWEKTDIYERFEEVKEKFNKLVQEHFPTAFQIRTDYKDMSSQKIQDTQIGDCNLNQLIRMSKGEFAGRYERESDTFFEIYHDGEEIKFSILGVPFVYITIDKDTKELLISFNKVTIQSDLQIQGNLELSGKVVGG
jgi:hypothetical protein